MPLEPGAVWYSVRLRLLTKLIPFHSSFLFAGCLDQYGQSCPTHEGPNRRFTVRAFMNGGNFYFLYEALCVLSFRATPAVIHLPWRRRGSPSAPEPVCWEVIYHAKQPKSTVSCFRPHFINKYRISVKKNEKRQKRDVLAWFLCNLHADNWFKSRKHVNKV